MTTDSKPSPGVASFAKIPQMPTVSREQAKLAGLLQEAEILRRNGSLEEAERRCRKALRVDPASFPALGMLGELLAQRGRYDEAAIVLARAVARNGSHADSRYNLGIALQRTGHHARAIDSLRASLELQTNAADAWLHIGISLSALRHHGEAARHYERAVALDPACAVAFENLAVELRTMGRCEEALEVHRKAIALRASDAGGLPRIEEARAFDDYLLTLNYCEGYDDRALLTEHLRYGERFAPPASTVSAAAAIRPGATTSRLRLGYVSPDFRAHSVSFFIEPILAAHDRGAVEVFCYDDRALPDEVNRRLRRGVEHWIACASFSDEQLLRRIRDDAIDVLIDLAGHTGGNRLGVFAARAAPLQISYLGYPGPVGVPAIDYRISDARADPEGSGDINDAVLRLSPSYFCYRAPEEAPAPRRPERPHPVFGCFNAIAKLSKGCLVAFARVLAAVPDATLLLKCRSLADRATADLLRQRMDRAGIPPSRVELRGWAPDLSSHLAQYADIDVALDSFPYNGATTTCEALWMGVPVVTVSGNRHAGRMGASLLHAAGLDELIAQDVAGYVRICTRLARDQEERSRLRSGLRERLARSPLTDATAFTRALEERLRALRRGTPAS